MTPMFADLLRARRRYRRRLTVARVLLVNGLGKRLRRGAVEQKSGALREHPDLFRTRFGWSARSRRIRTPPPS